MSNEVTSPFTVFFDRSGDPLDAGYIYVGTAGINPEVSPISVYWDAALTTPAAQPIRTLAGYPSQNGSPGTIIINQATYSIVVRDKNGALVYSNLNVYGNLNSVLYLQTYANLTALTTATGLSNGAIYNVAGRAAAGDGGEGSFRYDSSSTATANGGTILAIDGGGAGRFFRVLEADRIVWVQWFGDLTTASGFTAALRAAITAAGVGGEVHIPYGSYTYNDSFTPLSAQRIIGHGLPFLTKAANVASTFIMTNATRAEINGVALLGAGGTYTGAGVYMGAHADSYEQRVINCLIYDFAGPCVHFDGADAGSKGEVINGLMRRTNYTVDAAIVGTTTVDTAGNRKITDIITDGGVIVAVNKMFNTEISGCNGRNIDFSGSDTIQTRARVYGNRLATTGPDQDIYGNDNAITGNVIAGGLVLKGAASRCHISGNVLASGEVPEDESTAVGDNVNWIDAAEYTFTPTIKADSVDPALWASTFGRIQRSGKTLRITCGATAGASTTFGTGSWYVQLPSPFNGFVWKAQTIGSIRILDTGTQYFTGTASASAGGNKIYFEVTQTVGPTHPMTWANGDAFVVEIEVEIA
jgi:hypothetical protein